MTTEIVTLGIDVSDRYSSYCLLDAHGVVLEEGKLRTSEAGLAARFTEGIKSIDRLVLEMIETRYPEARVLQQVAGEGPLISLTFMLTIGDPSRFKKSREVGPYLGLVPLQRESGNSSPQLRISKTGESFLRQMLVNGAHYILGYRGPDCDLRRWGLERASGGKNAKKRAVVAVARRLAILLHRLWVTGEVYEPLRRGVAA